MSFLRPVLLTLVTLTALLWGGSEANALQVTRVSSPLHYMEGKVSGVESVYKAMYHAYRITNNDGVDYPNLFVALENIVGDQYLQLGPFEDGVASTGPLANGASKVVYFYLQATAASPGKVDAHTVSVYPSKPFTTALVSTNFSVTVQSTLVAQSNKVTTVAYSPAQPDLGGELQMTITGETGTIGNPPVFAYTPASALAWPSNSFELVGARLVITNVVDQSDTLIWNATSTANMAYTITYTFRVICANEGTAISMLNHIQSGGQNKHNAPDALPVAPVPAPTTSPVIIFDRSSATATIGQAGGTLTHNVSFRNDGTRAITFEDFIDRLGDGPIDPDTGLPTRGTYVPGSTLLNGVPTTLEPTFDPTTGDLRWSSSFTIQPAATLVFTYDIAYPGVAGDYPHASRAEISGGSENSGLGTACGGSGDVTQIDTTYDLSDDAPAVASISVAAPNQAPTQDNATLYQAVGDLLTTYTVSGGYSDPNDDAIGEVTIDGATGGNATYNETTGLITFIPDDPDAAGIWTVDYTVCDTGDPVECATATLTLVWNDPPTLVDRGLGSGGDPVLSFGDTSSFDLSDYLASLGLVTADDPDDGDTDGIGSTLVAGVESGVYGVTVDLGDGSACAIAADGTVTLTAGTAAGVYECWIEVCEELPANDARVCATTSIGFEVVECQVTDECSTGLICDTSTNTCVECVDDTQCSGVNNRCDTNTNTCVDCLSETDCDDSNECTEDLCTNNSCSNPSIDAGTECSEGVCDGVPTDPSCVECVDDSQCSGVNDRCDTTTNTCVDCLDAADCNDTNECTQDLCTNNSCSNPSLSSGTECTDGVCDGAATDPTCVECVDDSQCSGVTDRCDTTTNTCVDCLDAADCNDTNECTQDLCTNNSCSNPSEIQGTECGDGDVCDGAVTDPTCIECYITPDPDDVDPGCDPTTPECLVDPTEGLTCVECKRDADCTGDEVCNLAFFSCVDPDELTADDDNYLIQVGGTLSIVNPANGLLANDSVPPAADLTLTVVATTAPDPATEGALTVNQDGTLNFVPVQGFVGTVTFGYELSTPLGGFAEASVTIKVNGGPNATDDSATVDEDDSVAIDVLDNDSDPNGDALTVQSITAGPSNGSVSIGAGGVITYTPNANYNGEDTFTYRVCDIHNVCDTATVTVTVTPVNDAPVGRDDYGLTPEDTPILLAVLANDFDVEGDLLSLDGIARAPYFGRLETQADGTVLYVPDRDFHGRDTFVYTVCDPSGACDTALVTVDVEPVNDAPYAGADSVTTPEGSATTIDVLVNDGDVDGDDIEVTRIVIAPRFGTVEIGLDGALTYTPNDGYFGLDFLTYEVCDPSGACAQAEVVIDVGSTNNTPVAEDDTATMTAGGFVAVDVLANDSDPDGDILELVAVSPASHGVVTIGEDGIPVYTPSAGFIGTDMFSYTVCDPEGACASATVTVTVDPAANTAPVAADDTFETLQNQAVTFDVLANDGDLDGDTLVVSAISPASNGAFVVNGDGTVTYTPNDGFVGVEVVTVTIDDGNGGTATSTLTVFVNAVPNSPPTAIDDTFNVATSGAQSLDVLANDSDADGDTLIVVDVVQPSTGFVSIAQDGTLTFTPNANAGGTDTFTYTVSDQRGGFETATVTIIFPAPGLPPVARDDFAETPEDTAVLVVVLSNDTDRAGSTLTVTSLATSPSFGTAEVLPDSTVLYTPAPDFNGLDTFRYTVCNAAGDCAEGVATVSVLPVNDPPNGGADNVSTAAETPVTISVLDNDEDVDGDTLTVTGIASEPSEGTATVNADGTITYTPFLWPGYVVTDVFLYEVCDTSGACDIVPVTITVGSPNVGPTANDDTASTTAGVPVTVDVLANDTHPNDEATLTLTTVGGATNGWLAIVDGQVVYTPRPDFVGEETFFYTVCDDEGVCDTGNVTVTVGAGPNNPPIATDDVGNTLAGQPVDIDVLANDFDADGDTLFVVAITTPANGAVVVAADGTVTYTPAPGFTGIDIFEVTIADGRGGRDTATVSVYVTEAANQAPVAADDAVNASRRFPTAINVLTNDSDPDDDMVFIIDIVQPAHGTVTVGADGVPVYNPGPSAASADGDSFSYTISDGRGGLADAVVTLTFPVGNGEPVARDDATITPEDTAVIVVVLANDSDPEGDPIRVEGIATAPLHGTAVVNADGTVTYTPALDYNGRDSFTYTACDINDGCVTALVSVTVTPVNDAPVANDDNATTPAGQAVAIDVLTNDFDADGDDLTVFRVSFAPRFGTTRIENDGSITYTPNAGFTGTDTFTYEACDSSGACDRAVVSVVVGGTNNGPVAVADTAEVAAGDSVTIDVLANDSDADDDVLTLNDVTPAQHGSVAIVDGALLYTPAAGFTGTDSFAYTACDPSGACASALVTVTVTEGANLPPVAADDVASVIAGQSVVIPALDNDSDPDGDFITIVSVGTPASGLARIDNNGDIVYTATAGFSGLVTFEVTIEDERGGSATSTTYVYVTAAPNNAPTATDDAVEVSVETVTIDVLANDSDADGDTIVIVDVVEPSQGVITLNANGTIDYTPFPGAFGTDSFTYTISDGRGGFDTATVTLTYPVGNLPPNAQDDFATTPEDQGVLLNIIANDSDPEGETIAITGLATLPSNGTAVLLGNQTVSYTPTRDWSGTDSFTYTLCDASDHCVTGLVRVTVTPVNDAPVAGDDGATTAAGQAVAIAVLTNDYDVDGDTLAVSRIVIAPQSGSVSVGANGVVTYTPNAGFSGSDFFTYQACDAGGACDIALVTVVVGGANQAPVASDDTATAAFGGSVVIDVLANDTDPDGDTLTVTVVEDPAHGTAVLEADGTITFTPDAGFSGVATFFYTACDTANVCDTATVTVTVTPGDNRPPTAVDDLISTPRNVPATIAPLANDTDPDGDSLFINAITDPAHGTATVNSGGTVTYTPAPGYVGTDAFELTIADGNGGFTTSTVSVIVTPDANAVPNAADDTYAVSATDATTLNVLSNDFDADDDTLVIVEVIQPLSGVVSFGADGALVFTPNPGATGSDTFTYTASDGRGGFDTATVTLTFPVGNLGPVALDDRVTTPEDTGVLVAVIANDFDPEGGVLDVTRIVSQPVNGVAILRPDETILYRPFPNFNGTDRLVYEVCDVDGACTQASVVIIVTPVNDAPVANDDGAATTQGVAVDVNVLANDYDVDGDVLTVTRIRFAPASGQATVNGDGTITYTPTANFVGTTTFVYELCDPSNSCDEATVTVVVGGANGAPVAVDDAATVSVGQTVLIDVRANDTDPDDDTLTITSVTPPAHGRATVTNDGLVSYVAGPAFGGTVTFNYTVCDPSGLCDTATVTVTIVTEGNLPPVGVDDTFATARNTPTTFDVVANDFDPDGDTLRIVDVGAPLHGTVDVNATGELTYTPDTDFVGEDVFVVTISDGRGGFDTETIRVVVTADDNVAPDAIDDRYEVTGQVMNLNVLENDTDANGDRLTIIDVVQPQNGTVSINLDGTLLFVPTAGYTGDDTFSYTISDGRGGVDTAVVVLVGLPSNHPPVGQDDVATTPEDRPVLIAVLANDSDADGDALTVTQIATGPRHGTVTIRDDNTVIYTPNADWNGKDTFTYTVCDVEGLCAEASVVVTVTPVNDAPQAGDDFVGVPSGTVITVPVLDNDGDVDGDALTITGITVDPVGGTATVNEDGTITFTPDAGTSGDVTFTYEVCDASGACDEATVTVNVGDDTGAPVANDDDAETDEGVAVTIFVLDNDTAPTGEELFLVAVGTPMHGTATIVDGTVTYAPEADFAGTDSFFYTICDTSGACASAVVTVDVIPGANTPPVAVDDVTTTMVDTPTLVNVTSNDMDADGDTITVIGTSTPAHGQVTINVDGTVTYTPEAGYTGTDTFTVTISDGNGGTDTSTVTIFVQAAFNTPPVATDDTYDVDADVASVLAVKGNDSDADGDDLTIVLVVQPLHGTATIDADGNIDYTPDEGYVGADSFTYTVTDGKGDYATATVTIYVGDRDRDGIPDVIEEAGCTDPDDADTDNDGLDDGVELSGAEPFAYDVGVDTNPCSADTDNDGIDDGTEVRGDGILADIGALDPMSADTDGDGLQDGTEVGVTEPVAGGQSAGGKAFDGTDVTVFIPDADPETTTNPLDDDTDDDGLMDGTEDADHNGRWDGVVGGTGTVGEGETDPTMADTDGDCIQDGTELGLTEPEGEHTDMAVFVSDADPTTTSDPVDTDTDDGGLGDVSEDLNCNGNFDDGETDINDPNDDVDAYFTVTGGQNCGGGEAPTSLPIALALAGLAFLAVRRRQAR